MSAYQQAVNQLKEILKTQPPEPYTGRKRRPNNYRDSYEYHEWHKKRDQWAKRIIDWYKEGIEVYGDRQQACVLLYGDTVEGTVFRKQPEGWIYYASQGNIDEADRVSAPPVRLPGAKESLDAVFEYDRKCPKRWWNLKRLVNGMTIKQDINLSIEFALNNKNLSGFEQYERDLELVCEEARHQWAEAVRNLIDHSAVGRLRKWTGNPKTGYTLANHNLAIISGKPLAEIAVTNPGAAGWWMHSMSETKRPKSLDEGPPPMPPFPQHPGEIIALVRQEYAEAGGKHWKALASQPAKHVSATLHKHGRKATAWLSGALSEANLPEAQPADRPAPPPPPNAQQPALLELPIENPEPPQTFTSPAAPSARKPPAQPPLEIKLMILELYHWNRNEQLRNHRHSLLGDQAVPYNRNEELKNRTEAALRRLAMLASRNYAGAEPTHPESRLRARLVQQFQDMADFLFHDPDTAARARTWDGLSKACARWHGERNLVTLRQELAKEQERRAITLLDWETPLRELESEEGFRAKVLISANELIRESELLSHCVGSLNYADRCTAGHTRIVHIEPSTADGHRGETDQVDRKHQGTTLEIRLNGNRWQPQQHRGYHNRMPDDEEKRWAARFMEAWHTAIEERKQKILAQQRMEEPADDGTVN